MNREPRSAGAFATAVLFLVSIAFAWGAGEVLLRIVAPGQNTPIEVYDRLLGWRGRPNLRCVQAEKSFTIEIRQNSEGFRDDERTVARAEGVPRVLCVGDSYTWGWGVPREAIYTDVLERLMPGTEFVNAGVPGYNTVQCLVYTEERGFAYEPDVVVYQAAENDVDGNIPEMRQSVWACPNATLAADGKLSIGDSPVPSLSLWHRFLDRTTTASRLAYFLNKYRVRFWRWWHKHHETPEVEAVLETGEPVDYPFRVFVALLDRMERECVARGVRLIVLVDFDLSEDEAAYLAQYAPDVEAPPVRAYLLEREATEGVPAIIADDGHWTVDAHQWIAEYVQGLLAEPAP
jgi:hypothetical protein